ncbi:N-acetyltransferase [Clostridium sp. CF012]|uniref:GNAT family N-acetyltransferase n=1 Tax=Clostridium sp. CF012 TaxID=2843319 RepID=UPI001C0DC270|nr:GNAT family N-acetyltransferase [Clostridium sp. CF012]MBU3145197.1 GNAT family N-acetyltransferase [Clostridium sp. CF012]
MNNKLSIESELSKESLKIIEDGLRAFNLSKTSEENIPLNILLRSDDKIIGGLQGNYNAQWLYINSLWVDSTYRGNGYGRKMMLAVEEEVVKRGVTNSYLQTTHALGFYQKLGYEVFTVIENSPTGFNMYYVKKSLIL